MMEVKKNAVRAVATIPATNPMNKRGMPLPMEWTGELDQKLPRGKHTSSREMKESREQIARQLEQLLANDEHK